MQAAQRQHQRNRRGHRQRGSQLGRAQQINAVNAHNAHQRRQRVAAHHRPRLRHRAGRQGKHQHRAGTQRRHQPGQSLQVVAANQVAHQTGQENTDQRTDDQAKPLTRADAGSGRLESAPPDRAENDRQPTKAVSPEIRCEREFHESRASDKAGFRPSVLPVESSAALKQSGHAPASASRPQVQSLHLGHIGLQFLNALRPRGMGGQKARATRAAARLGHFLPQAD